MGGKEGGKGRGRRYRWMGSCGDEGEGFVQVKKINEERKTSGKEKFSFLF